jgi:hypothetical protein
MALPPDAGISRGFNLRLYASPNNPDRIFTNSSARARLQIEGALVGPSGPVTNEISHGLGATLRLETQAINYSQDGLDTGQFPGDTLFPVGEGVVPSLMAMEARAYLRLPAGVVTFGVASDDGFLLTAGDPDNLVLGAYEGTRGSQVPSEFPVLVYRAGVYPVGLLYYDGGGYASVEFYTAHNESATATQGRVLANADDEAGNVPVAAYTMVAPSAPTLHLRRDAGELVFSWSTNANYRLQETLRLNPASWTPTSLAPVLEGALLTGRLPLPTGGNKFYRLELQP